MIQLSKFYRFIISNDHFYSVSDSDLAVETNK